MFIYYNISYHFDYFFTKCDMKTYYDQNHTRWFASWVLVKTFSLTFKIQIFSSYFHWSAEKKRLGWYKSVFFGSFSRNTPSRWTKPAPSLWKISFPNGENTMIANPVVPSLTCNRKLGNWSKSNSLSKCSCKFLANQNMWSF